jgi:hydroxyethylthiazole kinase-like sugar kinase family protein
MRKRAVDLSLDELSKLGAVAAQRAAQQALDAGLVVTGTVDVIENGRTVSKLAQRHPSGEVVILDKGAEPGSLVPPTDHRKGAVSRAG